MVDLTGEGKKNEFCTPWGPCSSVSIQGRFRCGPACRSAKVAVNLGYDFLPFMWG